jgi:hypothetical protein
MNKSLLIISIACLIFATCKSSPKTETSQEIPGQINDSIKTELPVQYIDIIDTSRMAIIPLSNVGWMDENYTQAKLSIAELAKLDTLLFVSTEAYNQKVINEHDELMTFYREEAEYTNETFVEREVPTYRMIEDLSNYRRQYIPYYNEEGDKMVQVYCNCIHFNYEGWKTAVLHISDGGNCHFDALLNLTERTCTRISVNGYA